MVHNFLAVILSFLLMIALTIASFFISTETHFKICGVIFVLGIISMIILYVLDRILYREEYAKEREEKKLKKEEKRRNRK